MTTNSQDISNMLSQLDGYIGDYPQDALPSLEEIIRPTYMVVNTDDAGGEGEHWLGIVLKAKSCFYFDSYGLQVINMEIINFLTSLKYKSVYYSSKPVQHINSNMCGYYVASFLHSLNDNISYAKFLNMFDDVNLHKNDRVCIEILKKYI